MMATVRPISPQYQHTLDSAISLAKELASKNMADSSETSPKTPNSPDKKRFSFKLKHFGKSFSEASANIRDIESSITHKAKEAYESLIENGPYNSSSYSSVTGYQPTSSSNSNSNSYNDNHHHHHHHYHHNCFHRHHNTIGPQHTLAGHFASDDFSPSFPSSNKMKHVSASTFSMKRAFF